MIVVGRLGQGGQHGGLAQGQIDQRLVEIIKRRRGHAVGAEAEVNLVEVKLEDAILIERPLDPEGQDRFLDLAVVRDLVAEQEVLRHLLGYGRGTDQAAVAQQIADVAQHRAGHARQVDPEMLVKGGVFGCQKCQHNLARHHLDGHEDAAFNGVLRKQPAVARMDPGGDRRFVIGEMMVVGQAAAEMIEREEPAARRKQREHEESQAHIGE